MTSSINTGPINTSYPIAGQDNPSQGFRDNFGNIVTNLNTAANEITNLQATYVKKGVANDLLGTTISNATLNSNTIQFFDLGQQSNTVNISTLIASVQKITTAAPIILNLTDWHASGQLAKIQVWINVALTTHTITFPSSVSVGTTEINGFSGNVLTVAAAGLYIFDLFTIDGGTTVVVEEVTNKLALAPGALSISPITLPSATSVLLGAALSNTVYITNSLPSPVPIASFDSVPAGTVRTVKFIDGTTLTYDAVKLLLPGAVDLVTLPNDICVFMSLGAGNWQLIDYQPAQGLVTNSSMANTILPIYQQITRSVLGSSGIHGLNTPTGTAVVVFGTNILQSIWSSYGGTNSFRGAYYHTLNNLIWTGSGYTAQFLADMTYSVTNQIPATYVGSPGTVCNIGIHVDFSVGTDDTWSYYIQKNGTTIIGPINSGSVIATYTSTIAPGETGTYVLYASVLGGNGSDNLGVNKFYLTIDSFT